MRRSASKPAFCISIGRLALAVNVYCDDRAVIGQCTYGSQHLFAPGYIVADQPTDTPYEIWVIPDDRVSVQHNVDDKVVTLWGPIHTFAGAETIPYLAYGLLELAGAECGQFTMHGAVVSREDRCLAIFGKAGSGKTSVALALCTRHGYRLVSNDLVVVGLVNGRTQALVGTTHFFVRGAVIEANFPELAPLLVKQGDGDQSPWELRCSLTADETGVQINPAPGTIAEAYVVQAVSGERLSVSSPPPAWACLYLHENLTRYLRKVALPTAISWDEASMIYNPSYDRADFHVARSDIIRDLLHRANLTRLCGDLQLIVDYLAG